MVTYSFVLTTTFQSLDDAERNFVMMPQDPRQQAWIQEWFVKEDGPEVEADWDVSTVPYELNGLVNKVWFTTREAVESYVELCKELSAEWDLYATYEISEADPPITV
jgi:hypothetical protein